ncbi:MAG: hypothetical protein DRI83_12135 [Bacteroidetes bacterium]|nr:MAG: hypothetical protein DRI83_12135 [Bacteroidota bacterium]
MSQDGEIQIIGESILVPGQSIGESVFFIYLNNADVTSHKLDIEVGIYSEGILIDTAKATFIGPEK